jgi:hypothetical protein
MWRFETLIKGMRARKDQREVAVRMEAGLVDMGRRGEDSSVHEQNA